MESCERSDDRANMSNFLETAVASLLHALQKGVHQPTRRSRCRCGLPSLLEGLQVISHINRTSKLGTHKNNIIQIQKRLERVIIEQRYLHVFDESGESAGGGSSQKKSVAVVLQ